MTIRSHSLGRRASRRSVAAAVLGLVLPLGTPALAATGQGDLTDANIRYVERTNGHRNEVGGHGLAFRKANNFEV